eukprot:920090-Amphidinium_carterae.1
MKHNNGGAIPLPDVAKQCVSVQSNITTVWQCSCPPPCGRRLLPCKQKGYNELFDILKRISSRAPKSSCLPYQSACKLDFNINNNPSSSYATGVE